MSDSYQGDSVARNKGKRTTRLYQVVRGHNAGQSVWAEPDEYNTCKTEGKKVQCYRDPSKKYAIKAMKTGDLRLV